MQEASISYTKQLYDAVSSIVPQFHNLVSFTDKYPIQTLTYNYNTQRITGTLLNNDYNTLIANAGGNYDFTISDVRTLHNVVSVEYNQRWNLVFTFDRLVSVNKGSQISINGFTPLVYNTKYQVIDIINGLKLELAPINFIPFVTKPVITTYGAYQKNYINSGLNRKFTMTFDNNAHSFSFPMQNQIMVMQNTEPYQLSGGDIGCGYLHDFHQGIIHSDQQDIYSPKANRDLLCVLPTFASHVNKEKTNILDVQQRNDGALQGFFIRNIYSMQLNYVMDVTQDGHRIQSGEKAQLFYETIAQKLAGIPIQYRIPSDTQTSNVYYAKFSCNGCEQYRNEGGIISNVYSYYFNLVIEYYFSALLQDSPLPMLPIDLYSGTLIQTV
jgi:hypothetical protein